ncbi:MAG: hypothetical protein ABFR47_04070 [Verrucomicrobiota bacterium]
MAENKQTIDPDFASGIEMLEQILEVMPQDLMALKGLYNAYSQCGQREKAFEYMGLIAGIACDTEDSETAEFILEQLPKFEMEHPSETVALLARIRAVANPERQTVASSTTGAKTPALVTDVDISEELALAWRLYEENQLSQEEYSAVLHDLTEVSSKEINVPVTVLHVLNDRGFMQINRVMNYMSSRSGAPCISLLNFELSEEVVGVLPLEISASDGALPFGFLGNDLLVAVLNPFNNMLVDKVETTSGHRCHSYLVSADEYDVMLGKLREMAA